ncbi:MAG: M50 family metallopeptidase [Candidatus Saccharimonadales bacterium]
MGSILLIIGIILFIGLVVVHEWGHFMVARRNGVEAEEFGIFFPPRLYKRKTRKGWLFSIGLLPLGGFVKLKGEHDDDTEPGSFGAASFGKKVKIMLAGVGMNLLVAVILLTALAWLGMPKLVDNQFTVKNDTHIVKNNVIINYVEPGSPADKAGLEARDQLTEIGNQKVTTADTLGNLTKSLAGHEVAVKYRRDGQVYSTKAKLLSASVVKASLQTNNPKGYIGVIPTEYSLQRSTWSAPVVAVGLTAQFTGLTFQGLGHALAGLGGVIAGAVTGNHAARENAQTSASSQVAGPVGIFVILKDGSLLGYQFMLMIIAVISLTLAIMNILPIPALDGGRVFILLIARLLKKPVSAKVEETIVAAGFVLLIGLIILVTVVDVKRFF